MLSTFSTMSSFTTFSRIVGSGVQYNFWDKINGTLGQINAVEVDNSNNIVYLGGQFTYANVSDINSESANYITANNIVSYDISKNNWNLLGFGTNATVNTIKLDSLNNLLYIGGNFSSVSDSLNLNQTANNIAIWDLSENVWKILGSFNSNGTNGQIRAMVLNYSKNYLYVGGDFTYVYDSLNTNGRGMSYIAIWDIINNVWGYIGNETFNGADGIVYSLELDTLNSNLYIGGNFNYVYSSSVGTPSSHLAVYNYDTNLWGQQFSVNNSVYALVIDSSNSLLYIGGAFTGVYDYTTSQNLPINHIGSINTATNSWNYLGVSNSNGTNGNVLSLSLDNKTCELFIGGNFNTAYLP